MAAKASSECDDCGGNVGLWQASLTSECAHTFHLRCVSGRAACPVCAAKWKDTPVTGPAPTPATPFTFTSTSTSTGVFGFGQRPRATAIIFSCFSGAQSTSPSTSQPSERSIFGFAPAKPAAQPSSSSCSFCGGVMDRGQATVTSECAHKFHLRCISGSVCPVCSARWREEVTVTLSPRCSICGDVMGRGQTTVTSECAHTFHLRCLSGSVCPLCNARWRDEVTVAPSPPLNPFSSLTCPPLSTRPSFTFAASKPSSTTNFAAPNTCSSPARSSFSQSQSAGFSSAPSNWRNPSTTSTFWPPSTTPAFSAPNSSSSPPLSSVTSAPSNHPSTMPMSTTPQSSSSTPLSSLFSPSSVPTFAPPSTSPTTPQPSLLSRSAGLFSVSASSLFSEPAAFSFAALNPFSNSTPPSSSLFNDDEPVETPARAGQEATLDNGALVLKTHCESSAVARDAAHDSFAVLVHVKAPAAAASARAPLDLVTVLDVSGSMAGSKLALLKQAMGFVIDNLRPCDRLSIVAFSTEARRVIRLTRMSGSGKASAKGAMESLITEDMTNIGDGLGVAAHVLDNRRQRNAVAGIILLSDGHDNSTTCSYGLDGRKFYRDLVPHSLRRGAGNRCSPVHTFGFGTDHDAAAMQAIAEETGGTYSFVENQAVVQDSFAHCLGGLLSVAVQDARVAVECLHPGVRVREVKSGRYESSVDPDGRAAVVNLGEMYSDEERRFLLFLDVPVAALFDGGVTRLMRARCTYRDAATGQSVDVAGEDAVIQRPMVVADAEPSVEVARERFRVEAAEDIAAARAAAERGEHAEAARILDRRQEAAAGGGLAGDAACGALLVELRELRARVADRREYEQTGRAFTLAGITAHAQQRASTVQFTGAAAAFPSSSLLGAGAASTPAFGATTAPLSFSFGYATPAMQGMAASSRKTRQSAAGSLFGSNPATASHWH